MHCYIDVCSNRSHVFQASHDTIGWEQMTGKDRKSDGRQVFLSVAPAKQSPRTERISGKTQLHAPTKDSTVDVVCVEMLRLLLKSQKSTVTVDVSDEVEAHHSLFDDIIAFTYGLKLEAEKVRIYILCDIS